MKYLLSVLILLVATAAAFSQDKDAIFKLTKAANDASLQGHVERNVERIVAVYTDDATLLPPPGGEPIMGIRSIRDYYTKGMRGGRVLKVDTENISYEIVGTGHAIETGRYTLHYKADDAEKETVIKGQMLIVWKKNKNGEWKIKYDMWH